ncbi:MAG: hypothetical protein JNK16_12290 [Phycisphaerales bacterium]|nr:hypothetical protein [Phycisphaerales bacterium]
MVPRLQAQTRPFVPANTENFLDDVCKPELSLADLAKRYSTTVDALSVWLSRPDVVQRLAEIRSVSAQRAGFIAGMHLPYYTNSLANSLNQAVTESKCMSHFTLTIESNTLRVRYRENIRKTVALLANIARYERSAARWAKPRNTNPKPTSPPSNPPRPGTDSNSPRHTEPHRNQKAPSPNSVRTPAAIHTPGPNRAAQNNPHSRPAPDQRTAPPQGTKSHKRAKHNSPLIRAAASPHPPSSQSPSRKARTSSIPKAKPTSAPPSALAKPQSSSIRGRTSSKNTRQPGQRPRGHPSQSLPGPAP